MLCGELKPFQIETGAATSVQDFVARNGSLNPRTAAHASVSIELGRKLEQCMICFTGEIFVVVKASPALKSASSEMVINDEDIVYGGESKPGSYSTRNR
mmetsp:Transcript_51957/g.155938  ORF Transcript_51957/g.155938 Transcript_51957/m.155938 type:complete len:99 (-) Transcript_51957:144-440(-)